MTKIILFLVIGTGQQLNMFTAALSKCFN